MLTPHPASRLNSFPPQHTTQQTPLLDESEAEFELVDRHTGSLFPGACTTSKVLVATDSTAVDMGTFRRTRWAGKALRLEQGSVVVDYDAIETNLNRTKSKRAKKLPANKTPAGERATTFMMYFECPKTAGKGFAATKGFGAKQGPGAKDTPTRTAFSVAMRYISPFATNALASTPFQAFAQAASVACMLVYTNDAAFWQKGELLLGNDGAPFDPSSVHRPWCDRIRSLDARSAYCPALAVVQRGLLNPASTLSNCRYNYPSAVQPNIQQDQTLGEDLQAQALPGPFEDLLANPSGRLPDVVPAATTAAESATLFWLYSKATQLALYAPCSGGGSVPFASIGQFAPNFGPSTLHYVSEPNEVAGSNFTHTPLAYSGTGPDRDGLTTTVVVFRGTMTGVGHQPALQPAAHHGEYPRRPRALGRHADPRRLLVAPRADLSGHQGQCVGRQTAAHHRGGPLARRRHVSWWSV